ncbi:hypothetical protein BDV12DRAFT_204216 [Aspergillus spectabilis]
MLRCDISLPPSNKNDGATLIDQHIFQHACGGLLLGILSAGYTLRLLYFADRIPESRDTPLEYFVRILRNQNDDEPLNPSPPIVGRMAYLLKSSVFAFLVQLLLRNPVFSEAFETFYYTR